MMLNCLRVLIFCAIILPHVISQNVLQYDSFHQEFLDNLNRFMDIERHNVEYIKPSIELGSFTVQTVVPSNQPENNNNNNQKENTFFHKPANEYVPPQSHITTPTPNFSSNIRISEANFLPMPQFLERKHKTYTKSQQQHNLELNNQIPLPSTSLNYLAPPPNPGNTVSVNQPQQSPLQNSRNPNYHTNNQNQLPFTTLNYLAPAAHLQENQIIENTMAVNHPQQHNGAFPTQNPNFKSNNPNPLPSTSFNYPAPPKNPENTVSVNHPQQYNGAFSLQNPNFRSNNPNPLPSTTLNYLAPSAHHQEIQNQGNTVPVIKPHQSYGAAALQYPQKPNFEINSLSSLQTYVPPPAYNPLQQSKTQVGQAFENLSRPKQVLPERNPQQTYVSPPTNNIESGPPNNTPLQQSMTQVRHTFENLSRQPQVLPEGKLHQTYGQARANINPLQQNLTSMPQVVAETRPKENYVPPYNNRIKPASNDHRSSYQPENRTSQNFENPPQIPLPVRKPHQTYGPQPALPLNDHFAFQQFMSQVMDFGNRQPLLQTSFLPKTDAELDVTDDQIHTINFPPQNDASKSKFNNLNSLEPSPTTSKQNTNEPVKGLHNIETNQFQINGIDTKYASDGGYIY